MSTAHDKSGYDLGWHPGWHLARGAMVQVAGRIAVLFTGLLSMGLLSRGLGVEEFGVYAVAVMLAGWISISVTVATYSATVRLVAGHEKGLRYAKAMLKALSVLGLVVGVLFLFLAEPVAGLLRSPALAKPLQVLAADVFLTMPLAAYGGILVARAHFFRNVATMLGGAFAQIGLVLLFLSFGWGVAGACMAVVGGSLIHFVLAGCFTGLWPWLSGGVPLAHLWRQVRWLAASNLALRISQSMDLLALKIFTTSAVGVGLYAGAQNLSIGAMLAFLPVGGVALQAISAARKTQDQARADATADYFLRATICYATFLGTLSVLAPDACRFFLGESFVDSAPLLGILLWAVAFRVLAVAGRNFIAAVGESISLLWPLLGLIVLGMIAFAFWVPLGGAFMTALIALLLAIGGSVASLREGLRMIQCPFPWLTLGRAVFSGALAALAGSAWPGEAAWVFLPKAALLLIVFLLTLGLLGEWKVRR